MVQIGLHQGSALSSFLFNVVFDVLTEAVRENPPWCVLYADDVILLAKNKRALQRKFEHWREALESRALRISRNKTEYMTTDTDGDQKESIQMDGIKLKRVTSFKYLGSMLEPSGRLDKEIRHRIQSGWNNWKLTGVTCNRKVPVKLNGKIHKAVVMPAMMYALETAAMRKTEKRKLNVVETKMLRYKKQG
ncbi:hypothetical protein Pmani_006626 [Petrolisthes manimaculis]|uniref:Reverse transcriptase domain-containing protein n=1 Tax=Petrolisthes manimaculis TaxID=1843537 RepID=A0AAE1QA46_9EUCA|nr:hypothetical protein Pmani_006626 [Petrolisthes manimaculis]